MMTDEQTVERVAKSINGPHDKTHIGADKLRELQDYRWTHQSTSHERVYRLNAARAAIAAMQPALAEAEARGRNAGLRRAATELEVNWCHKATPDMRDAILAMIDTETAPQPDLPRTSEPQAAWQSIETAPKDQLIDIWLSDGLRWCDCYYDTICEEWRTSRPTGRLLRIHKNHVTHWMHRPVSPREDQT